MLKSSHRYFIEDGRAPCYELILKLPLKTRLDMALEKLKDFMNININNLKKDELLKVSKNLQNTIRNLIDEFENPTTSNLNFLCSRLNIIEKNQESQDEEMLKLKAENEHLKKQIKNINKDLDEHEESLISLEKSTSQIDQYIRRENVEITGISSTVPQENLEGKVIEIFNSIVEEGNEISKNDIVACHRLKKDKNEASPKVIVRFLNRKKVSHIHRVKKKLANNWRDHGPNQIYVNDNLCPANQNIMDIARGLKKNNHISSCWSQNGMINLKFNENDSKSVRINHVSDFEDHFSLGVLGWQ